MGQITKGVISRQTRLARGYFPTPLVLCDRMIASIIRHPKEIVLDPATGDGRFLRQVSRLGHASECLFGVDILPDGDFSGMDAALYKGSFLGSLPWENGSFDVIIGNPPYVRHELRDADLKKQVLLLRESDPALSRLPETMDLYLWFFIRAWQLLKPGGRLCFVTSNSWLFTHNGQVFSQWLTRHYQITHLIESGVERWFEDAAIHGVVSILKKRPQAVANPMESIQSIRLTVPLEEVTDITRPNLSQAEVNLLRHDEFCGGKANFAMHAPAFLKTLPQSHWVALESLANVRYPIKTGINSFFYLNGTTARKFGIEEEFLRPVMKSAKNITHYTVSESNCPCFLFSCTQTPEELAENKKTGALNYIAWGEQQQAPARQKRREATPWPQVASVQQRPYWYQIPGLSPPDILCNRFTHQRFFFATCQEPLIEDQTFYGLTLNEDVRKDKNLIAALLNSTVTYMLLELSGQTNLGEGVLQCARRDMAGLWVPNPSLYSPALRKDIAHHWKTMQMRQIYSISQELQQADRHVLDTLVLRVFPEVDELQQQIYHTLLSRVESRLRMARTVISA